MSPREFGSSNISIGNMDVDEQSQPQRTRRPSGTRTADTSSPSPGPGRSSRTRPRQSRSNSFRNSGHARALSLASGGASVRSLGVGSIDGPGDSESAASSQGHMSARDIADAAASASPSASSLRRGHGSTGSLGDAGGTASGTTSGSSGHHNCPTTPTGKTKTNGGLIRSDTPLNVAESAALGFTTPNLLPRSYHESVSETDRSFRMAAGVALIIWTSLLYVVLGHAPRESFEELDPIERMCTIMATAALAVSNLSRIVPLIWRRRANAFSGIIVAACTIQFIAVATNAVMLAVPTPVLIDPVTRGRVHLLRWVEWTPLAAVMTFLTEGVDVPHPRYGVKVGLYHGMAQGISTAVGLLFPFVPNRESWFVLLTVACVLFCALYVRIYQKRRVLSTMERGRYADEVELYDRAELSLRLMTTCAVVWTLLILLYFFGWAAPRYLPHIPIVGSPSLPMLTETSCELMSKVLYLTIIVDVHDAVFDESSRAERRLKELRYMMSAVWDSSSDVIAISVRNAKSSNVTTMVSPTFAKLEDAIAGRLNDDKSSEEDAGLNVDDDDSLDSNDDGSLPTKRRPKKNDGSTKALVFELDERDMRIRPRRVSSFNDLSDIDMDDEGESSPEVAAANDDDFSRSSSTASGPRVRPKRVHFLELKGLPTETGPDVTKFKEEPTSGVRPGVVAMGELLVRAWNTSHSGEEVLLMHDIVREENKTGEIRHVRCEAKVTRLENDAILVVVRDISERFRRFEAEKRVVMEKTARTKDAEANRFTRHEVKNGLLAAIGLCDSLREAFGDEETSPKTPEQPPADGSADTLPALIEEPKSPTDATKKDKEEEAKSDGKSESQLSPPQAKSMSSAEILSSVSKAWKRKLHDASGHEVDFDIRRCMAELDSTLREVLDTILAQSMARDVMHGIYEPKLERVKMESALYGVRGASAIMDESNRFPLLTHPQPLPEFLIDPQLLRFIHRNATSNACKYGKRGGTVLSEITFDKETSQLYMDVINHPGEGHDELLQLGRVAEQAVFDAGRRLHPELGDTSQDALISTNQSASHSAGDGAWIMKKCAKTLGGDCRIKFEPSKTTFTLSCPVKAIVPNPRQGQAKEFRLPPQTWGIAIDDSKIQRKLLGRFLGLCGVDKEKTVILGETTEEIMAFEETVCDIVRSNPDAFILVIVDENLDVKDDHGHKTVSGSLCVEGIRRTLSPEEEKRILALVRSANDSSEDIAIYRSRAHGYLLKAPVKKDAVLDSIAPWWTKRFRDVSGASITSDVDGSQSMSSLPDDIIQVSSAEIMQTLEVIDALCRQGNPATLTRRWPIIWEKLHVLKGDMKTLKDNVRVSAVLEAIDRLQGSTYPEDFLERWQLIKSLAVSTM